MEADEKCHLFHTINNQNVRLQFLSALSNKYRYICVQQMKLMEYDNPILVF